MRSLGVLLVLIVFYLCGVVPCTVSCDVGLGICFARRDTKEQSCADVSRFVCHVVAQLATSFLPCICLPACRGLVAKHAELSDGDLFGCRPWPRKPGRCCNLCLLTHCNRASLANSWLPCNSELEPTSRVARQGEWSGEY